MSARPSSASPAEPPRSDPHGAIVEPVADTDPEETAEWREALAGVVRHAGVERARALLDTLAREARAAPVRWRPPAGTPYVNTVPVEEQPPFPGDLALEERLASLMRWNALAMVVRANRASGELGGHIASYASAADLFEVGFNHFFRGPDTPGGGDLVFYQPHSAPGVYARAFLEGRLEEADLAHYRREISARESGARGLSSYPHPWLMPDFWQFPTGSMGLGPISSIYQARFLRYLAHRGLADTAGRRVWGVFGDGEMDEPESMSALTLAAREGLDNLVWVVNCNLQRLDGPVRGNGRIVDELEVLFAGAGWNVVKLLWGSDWDGLFARDEEGALADAFSRTVDGELQTFAAKDGAYNRERFFGRDPRLARLAEGLTDEEIDRLRRGGHDLVKIHAAYAAAVAHRGRPTVILAQTKKGYGMGASGQGRMTTHQQKQLEREDLLAFRDRFALPLGDEEAAALAFLRPDAASPEMRYLHARRAALGGPVPVRRDAGERLAVPPLERWGAFATGADGKAMSTTMAFVRLLSNLFRDPVLGPRIVPIVADEARTFGMANLFERIGIYSSAGQRYEPEDIGSVLSYREATDGQILEEGISEAGAISSWTAAATSYAVNALPMLPFYIYYSMFGFQRVGDLIWAAADQRARGFLLGATSGRTTLSGEGLQHQDGSSLVAASLVPSCRVYDPAFAGELALIVDRGARAMLESGEDVFYYLTLSNANFPQPSLPEGAGEDVLRGLYRFAVRTPGTAASAPRVRLVGSGAIMTEVLEAGRLLAEDWGVEAELWSATSFAELAREAQALERRARLHPGEDVPESHVSRCLSGEAPVVIATDHVRAWPQLVAGHVAAPLAVLGTDGFGRSDGRAAMRRFFEVDAPSVVLAAVHALAARGALAPGLPARVIERYAIAVDDDPPWTR